MTNRITSDYGKNPNELEALLNWHKKIQDYYQDHGAITIDATRPIHEVVDEILNLMESKTY